MVMIAIVAPQFFLAVKTPWTWPVRLSASFAMFPVVEGLAALVLGSWDGYWSH